jgi:stage III sporulation protein AG
MTISWSKDLFKQKKQYLILGALALLGITLLCIGNNTNTELKAQVQSSAVDRRSVYDPANSNDLAVLEYKLADILSKIQGAGHVTVQITVRNSGRKEYALDTQRTSRTTIEESADTSQHTTELQEQQTVVQQNRSGTQDALLVEETAPEITGVLIVASGAGNALVQARLLHAAETLLQISLHQIVVMPGEEAV